MPYCVRRVQVHDWAAGLQVLVRHVQSTSWPAFVAVLVLYGVAAVSATLADILALPHVFLFCGLLQTAVREALRTSREAEAQRDTLQQQLQQHQAAAAAAEAAAAAAQAAAAEAQHEAEQQAAAAAGRLQAEAEERLEATNQEKGVYCVTVDKPHPVHRHAIEH